MASAIARKPVLQGIQTTSLVIPPALADAIAADSTCHRAVSSSFPVQVAAFQALSARWYGLEALLVCAPHQLPEAVLRRSSDPHKKFSWLQTAHQR